MASFTYTTGVPNPPNLPSQDVNNMQTNTNSINSIIAVDHIGFNTANGGIHNQARIKTQGAAPGGRIAGEGTIYTKTVQTISTPASEGSLFYVSDTNANEYQLTRTIDSKFATFATFTNYVNTDTGGWTFLPGGMLFQYGRKNVNNGDTINFPVPFANGNNIAITITRFQGNTGTTYGVSSSSTSSFVISTSGGLAVISWMAIGV